MKKSELRQIIKEEINLSNLESILKNHGFKKKYNLKNYLKYVHPLYTVNLRYGGFFIEEVEVIDKDTGLTDDYKPEVFLKNHKKILKNSNIKPLRLKQI